MLRMKYQTSWWCRWRICFAHMLAYRVWRFTCELGFVYTNFSHITIIHSVANVSLDFQFFFLINLPFYVKIVLRPLLHHHVNSILDSMEKKTKNEAHFIVEIHEIEEDSLFWNCLFVNSTLAAAAAVDFDSNTHFQQKKKEKNRIQLHCVLISTFNTHADR